MSAIISAKNGARGALATGNSLAIVKKAILLILQYVALCFVGFVALYPLVSIVITAFKSAEEYSTTTVMTPPQTWAYFDNFTTAWKSANMGLAFVNSAIILIFVLGGSVLISSMLAFVLNRFKFRGNELIRSLFLLAALVPGVAMQVTVYQIMYTLGFINTMHGYIILMLGTDVISIYIFLQFFVNLPVSLDESAIIDGCTYFGVFFKILFPLLQPAIVTCMILKGVGTYNEYYMANLYLQDKNRFSVVATSLYTFTGPMGNQYNFICAGVIITIIPALIIFILCQKQIYAGLANGAVKG
ncbi:MAG: carbohydrate ABC transporter permease [Treponema sp.]|jgi:multiple sugar transport system permease protein|nr:carbohydrate ABC transporter permease [Treponema sp.]